MSWRRPSESRIVPTSSRASAGSNSTTAEWRNSRPSTAATWSTLRSAAPRRSIRAASSAWIVGGTTSSPLRSAPLFSASSCSRKKGFPSAASTIRRRSSGASSRSVLRCSASVTDSASARGVRTTKTAFPRGTDHAGRSSSSSGRVRQRMTIRAPLEKLATYSSRSSNVSSAQWMSSTTRTSGCSRASASKSRRNAQDVSSPELPPASAPNAPATTSAIASRRSSSATSSRTAVRASAPRTGWSASASGRNVMPSPYGAQRPISTRTESPSSRQELPRQP